MPEDMITCLLHWDGPSFLHLPEHQRPISHLSAIPVDNPRRLMALIKVHSARSRSAARDSDKYQYDVGRSCPTVITIIRQTNIRHSRNCYGYVRTSPVIYTIVFDDSQSELVRSRLPNENTHYRSPYNAHSTIISQI